ncbi:hypothetical protein CKA32_006401 [Geitlerinema sp. FC II]|nr:hypothetical protein CKA32_006401 [Geitlerinema sp. FC II]
MDSIRLKKRVKTAIDLFRSVSIVPKLTHDRSPCFQNC